MAQSCWIAEHAFAGALLATIPAASTVSVEASAAAASSSDPTLPATTRPAIPDPQGMAGKQQVGRITAKTGQVIENLHISTAVGACIVVPAWVSNVTIRNNEIGPCGTDQGTVGNEGVAIFAGASDITVERNVIHDISAGVLARGASHPIVVDRNFIYNIRGPIWQGNIVQFADVRAGTGQSRITCNVKDGQYSPGLAADAHKVGDHISMYNSLGTREKPIEIAYNRILGDPSNAEESGSGMQLGDGENGGNTLESGWYHVHNNTIVMVNGSGIGVAGGHDILIENNRIDQRGPDLASSTGWAFGIKNFSINRGCYNIAFENNRATIAKLWAFNHDGSAGEGIMNAGGCTFTSTGNIFNDAALNGATPRATFDQPYPQCR